MPIQCNMATDASLPSALSSPSQKGAQAPKDDVLSFELKAFYKHHEVSGIEAFLAGNTDVDNNNDDNNSQRIVLPRFIRLNPRYDKKESLLLLTKELSRHNITTDATCDGSLSPVVWLDEHFGFYALPGSFKLSQSEAFASGRIYGMDVSSGAAVAALLSNLYHDERATDSLISKGEPIRILDLCCCPGLKLSMMADLVPSSSTVVGVDVSESRMSLCKRIVSKYHVHPDTSGRDPSKDDNSRMTRMRLYQTDGTTFGVDPSPDLVFDSHVQAEEVVAAGKRKRMNKSARARQRRRLKEVSLLDATGEVESKGSQLCCAEEDPPVWVQPFDYVLVDAECSTDGSLKHVQQRLFKQRSMTEPDGTGEARVQSSCAINPTLTDPMKLQDLVDLQKRLIDSGFRLLKPGGMLVYATCSLSEDQNEHVVRWLLGAYPQEAALVPIAFPLLDLGSTCGSLEGTVRFLPNVKDTTAATGGGFFIAKLVRRVDSK